MNIAAKAGCRAFQFIFHMALPFLPYREPQRLSSITDIAKVLNQQNIRSVLVVTDRGLRRSGAAAYLESLLKENGIRFAIYDRTDANPTVQNVEEARKVYCRHRCEALIALGGGSPMDCAKAMGARIAYPHRSVNQMKGLLRVLRPIPTLFAIPTTAGTGSEVTITAVITDNEKQHKYTMNNFTMIPSYAVHDPSVTYTLPPHLTAATGMDAMTHAVEAYIGGSTSKETRALALDAVRRIFANIETAYQDGTNHKARAEMLRASYQAGIAFSKSYVGYIHAVAHSLGGMYHIPHGLANAVLMPIVLEEYGAAAYQKLHELGIAAGVATDRDSHKAGAKKMIAAIRELNRRMGIPAHLSGIRREDIPKMARFAAKEANPLYPVPKLMNAAELERFYEKVADWSV